MFRTRMYDVKNNFRNKYVNKDLNCSLCQSQKESMEHVYHCQVIENIMGLSHCNFEDLFSNDMDIVYRTALKTKEIADLRNLLLNP